MKEDGFQAFISTEVDTENPEDVVANDEYIDSVAQAKVSVDPDVMAIHVIKEDLADTTSIGSDKKVVQLHKVDK